MQQNNPAAKLLAFLFLILLLMSLGGRFWALDKAGDFVGPTHLATDARNVVLFASGTFYKLSADGELASSHSYDWAGLSDTPIDLRIVDGGQLLVVTQGPAAMKRCNTETWLCQDISFPATHRPEHQFKVLLNTPHGQIIFTDSRDNSIWLVNESGETRPLLAARTLLNPNDLALDQESHLWVADTNRRRMVELIPSPDGDWQIGREHSTQNELTIRDRHFPMMLTLSKEGSWWVTQAGEGGVGDGDLFIYDMDEGVTAQVLLPDGHFATDIATLGDHVLVTDLETYSVYKVNSSSLSVEHFGDNAFKQAMLDLQDQKARYQKISSLSMAGVILFGLLMVLTAAKATPKDKRWTPVTSPLYLKTEGLKMPEVKGAYWLKRNVSFDRMIRIASLAGPIGLLVMIAGCGMLYLWMQMQLSDLPGDKKQELMHGLGVIMFCLSFLFIVFIPLINLSMKNLKIRLGTDGKQLLIRLADGSTLKAAPENLLYSHRAILYRQHMLPIQTAKKQSFYEKGEVEKWIAPLLQQAKKTNEWGVMKYQWEHARSNILWPGVLIAALILIAIVMSQLD